ncbi:MAG: DUF4430 domain-containing protein [Clostridia bacterium]|nr:DUF4430 domain-containing protein [Clostridia bacterium]
MKKRIFAAMLAVLMLAVALTACSGKGESYTYSAKVTVSCESILEDMSVISEEKQALVPTDGYFLKDVTVGFNEGESAFTVLERALKDNKLHFEHDSAYIKGIGNIYTFDAGDMSGWLFKVNGEYGDVGLDQTVLSDGDELLVFYACDFMTDM